MRTELVEAAIARSQAERDVSGTVLVTEEGRSVFAAHVGLADRAAGVGIDGLTRFALGSITKRRARRRSAPARPARR